MSRPRPERHFVVGRLVQGGGDCTILIIREGNGWILYPHGATGTAVELSTADAETLARGILGISP